jgi:1-acyl-sn-glycerol-3-phosphate acyltransferase
MTDPADITDVPDVPSSDPEPSPASPPAGEHDEAWRARLPSPVHPPTAFERALYRIIRGLLAGLSKLWFRLEIVGGDKVPTSGPFVLTPVHRSNIDFFLVSALTKARMRYMGKDSLWKFAPLGRFIAVLGGFPVRRGSADRESLRICMQVIENGEPLVLFPEGQRRDGDAVVDVFDGAAYVAARTGVPMVPVGIGGSQKAMPKGSKFIKPTKIVLVVGDPIMPPQSQGTGRVPRRVVRELTEQLRAELQELYDDARHRVGDA